MKKKLLVLVLFAAVAFTAAAAEPADYTPAKGDFGLVVSFFDLLRPQIVDDGFSTGAGIKFLITPEIRLRGILGMNVSYAGVDPNVVTTTDFELSIAGEYHFKPAAVSPYLGVSLALDIDSTAAAVTVTTTNVYFSIIGGVEVNVFKSVFAFVEYDATFTFAQDAENVPFTIGNDLMVGFTIYF